MRMLLVALMIGGSFASFVNAGTLEERVEKVEHLVKHKVSCSAWCYLSDDRYQPEWWGPYHASSTSAAEALNEINKNECEIARAYRNFAKKNLRSVKNSDNYASSASRDDCTP